MDDMGVGWAIAGSSTTPTRSGPYCVVLFGEIGPGGSRLPQKVDHSVHVLPSFAQRDIHLHTGDLHTSLSES